MLLRQVLPPLPLRICTQLLLVTALIMEEQGTAPLYRTKKRTLHNKAQEVFRRQDLENEDKAKAARTRQQHKTDRGRNQNLLHNVKGKRSTMLNMARDETLKSHVARFIDAQHYSIMFNKVVILNFE
jgi:hypothetical protein